MHRSAGLAWIVAAALMVAAHFASAAPIPAPLDRPYPGTLQLRVDATDLQHRVLNVRETVPVRGGELVLRYPQWLPGNHAPRGTIDQLAGLQISAGGKPLVWQRDAVDVFAFRVQVPAGVREIEVEFQVATPQNAEQGRVVMNAQMLGLQWNQVLLYPAGHFVSAIPVASSLRLPGGWEYASALGTLRRDGAQVQFETTSVEVLVDSPVFAGQYAVHLDLDPGAKIPVRANVFAEFAAQLEAQPEQLAVHRKLVRETYAAFGPPHYDRYEFLLALSNSFGGIGLEHHRSTEISLVPDYFTEWGSNVNRHYVTAHEFVHSWNGKYRRPRDLWTPDYSAPMQGSLLWVYEGLTQYYGWVLAARSGLWSPEFTRELLAANAGTYDRKTEGRAWRPVADTTRQPVVSPRRPQAFPSWQRTEDYYAEGALIWLDVDSKLRELSGDARSLDDFARRFFAAAADRAGVATYTFPDVVATLQGLAPFDWQRFLRERIEDVRPAAPLDGFARSGWRLVYDDKASDYIKDLGKSRKSNDYSYSLGFTVNNEGNLTEVVWDSPAFRAGLAPQTQLVAVNGRAWTNDVLTDALQAAGKGGALDLLVRKLDEFRTVRIDYRGGALFPHLQRIDGTPDRLTAILKPRG